MSTPRSTQTRMRLLDDAKVSRDVATRCLQIASHRMPTDGRVSNARRRQRIGLPVVVRGSKRQRRVGRARLRQLSRSLPECRKTARSIVNVAYWE